MAGTLTQVTEGLAPSTGIDPGSGKPFSVQLRFPVGNGPSPTEIDFNQRQMKAAQAVHSTVQVAANLEQMEQNAKENTEAGLTEVREHPVMSAIKVIGAGLDPVGYAAGTLGSQGMEAGAKKLFPNHPVVAQVAGLLGGIIAGNKGTALTKGITSSGILGTNGEPITLGAEQEVKPIELTPEEMTEEGTVKPRTQASDYTTAFEKRLNNPNDAKFAELPPRTVLNSTDKAELNIAQNQRTDNLKTLAQNWIAAKSPEERQAAETLLDKEIGLAGKLFVAGRMNATETGQALAIHNTDWVRVKQADQILQQMTPEEKEQGIRSLAALGEGKEATAKVDNFFGRWFNGDTPYKALIDAQLMNPRITLEKLATDLISIPHNIIHQALGTAVLHPLQLPTAGKMFVAGFQGMWNGMWEGAKFARETMMSGKPEFSESIAPDAEQHIYGQETLEALKNKTTNILSDAMPDRVMHWLASSYGIGVRMVMTADQFAKAMAYRAEENTQALYKGLQQAEKDGLHWTEALRAAEHNAEAYKATGGVADLAYGNMLRDTYTDSDTYTDVAAYVARKLPVVRIFAPYMHTPINLFEQGLMNGPLAPVTSKFWQDLSGSSGLGELTRNTDFAKMATGTAFMTWIGYQTAKGLITGDHPADGNPNHARCMHNGNEYISYAHMGPFATLIAVAANFAEHWGDINKHDQNRLALASSKSFMDTFANAPLMDVAMRMMELVQQVQEGGVTRGLGKFGGQTLAGFIPQPVQELAKLTSPTTKNAQTLWQEIEKNLPGLSDRVPPTRDMFGEPQYIPPGSTKDEVPPHWYWSLLNSMNPFTIYQNKQPDELDKEIMRLEPKFGRTTPDISITKNDLVHLTPKQQDHWDTLSGKHLYLRSPYTGDMVNKHEYMVDLINSDEYQSIPDMFPDHPEVAQQHQKSLLEGANHYYMNVAKQYILNHYPDLKAQVETIRQANTPQQVNLGAP